MKKNFVVLVALLFSPLVRLPAAEGEVSRPSVVLIVVDDLGYGELGCYGGRDVPTPHIDSLASNGVRFTTGYVTAPFCAASRAALMTGRYQTRFGFEFNPIGAQNAEPGVGLPIGERTMAEDLRENGYVTGLVGKWHLGGSPPFHPQRRGFDEFFGFLHEGHYFVPSPWDHHVTWLRRKTLPEGGQGRWISSDRRTIWSTHMKSFEPDYDADNPLVRSSQPVAVTENLTLAFTREAEQFIAHHREQHFFLCVAYNAVHSPMQATDEYLNKFSHISDIHRRIFAAMLAQLDDGVGRILAKLKADHLEDRTLVMFLSDNGGPTRELTSGNGPLRGEKGQLLEGGIRVPFLMQWKNQLPAGHEETRMVSSLDVFPTVLAATSAASAGVQIDGVNLLTYLTGADASSIRATHYWRVGSQAAFRDGDWKIYRSPGSSTWQLFHISEDLGEARDLAEREPERVADLAASWQELDHEMTEPLWGSSPRRSRRGNSP